MPQLSIDTGVLYYETHGHGTPLVLVSGLGGVGLYWRPQVPTFAEHFRVILYDHRGVGQSTPAPLAAVVEDIAGDLVQLLDALGIAQAHLVGHSLGGAVAQVMAIEHPERLLSLVLCASWPRADAWITRVGAVAKQLLLQSGASAYMQLLPLFLYPPWWVNAYSARLEREHERVVAALPPPEIMVQRIDGLCAFNRHTELGQITTPTLVLGARDDTLAPAYCSEALASLIPGAQLVLLERGGHACSTHRVRGLQHHCVVVCTHAGPAPYAARGGHTMSHIAIIGAGAAGLTAAYLLQQQHQVTLFEKERQLGGHARTIEVTHGPDAGTPLDVGFMVLNDRNYPTLHKLLAQLGNIEIGRSEMSFSYASAHDGIQYAMNWQKDNPWAKKTNGAAFSTAQRTNTVVFALLKDIVRFCRLALHDLQAARLANSTLREYLCQHNFSAPFITHYLLPMGAAIWSTPAQHMGDFPAEAFIRFFAQHGLLALTDGPQWQYIKGGSHTYVEAMSQTLHRRAACADPRGVSDAAGAWDSHHDARRSSPTF